MRARTRGARFVPHSWGLTEPPKLVCHKPKTASNVLGEATGMQKRHTHGTRMHGDTRVQETELGQEGGESSSALAGFPADQARATLEPDGPKTLDGWDGEHSSVMGNWWWGTSWEGMRLIPDRDNSSSLDGVQLPGRGGEGGPCGSPWAANAPHPALWRLTPAHCMTFWCLY